MSRAALNGSRSRAPILASSSAPASARAAISPAPRAPVPIDSISHTRDGVVGVFATLLRDDVSLFGLEDGRVIVRGPDLDVERPSRAVVVHPPDGWRGCAGGVRLLAQLPDDADERLNDRTADTDGIRTRARTRRVFAAYDNGSWARLRRDARGNGACLRRPRGRTPSSPIPLGSFRFASVRVVRADRRASAPFASRPTARRCISPLPSSENGASTGWDLPPESEEEGDAASGGKALGKHAWGSVTRLELHTDAVRCLAELPAAISRNVGLAPRGRRLRAWRRGVLGSIRPRPGSWTWRA